MSHPCVVALVPGNNTGTVGPSHFYRLVQPIDTLRRVHGWPTRCLYLGGVLADGALRQVMKEADILVTWRAGFTHPDEAKAFLGELHDQGKTFVLDVDDYPNQWNRGALATARGADLVTVTTEALAKEMRAWNPRVVVLPNSIDPALWPDDHVEHDPPVVGLFGGPTHDKDWRILSDVWPIVHARYPAVPLVVAGSCPTWLARSDWGVRRLGWLDRERMPAVLASWDIGLAPLRPGRFNASKSNLHYLEFGAAGVAGVYSPTVYAVDVEDGRNGLIARSAADWVDRIEELIEQPARRRSIATAARADVLARFDARVTCARWATAYRAALE